MRFFLLFYIIFSFVNNIYSQKTYYYFNSNDNYEMVLDINFKDSTFIFYDSIGYKKFSYNGRIHQNQLQFIYNNENKNYDYRIGFYNNLIDNRPPKFCNFKITDKSIEIENKEFHENVMGQNIFTYDIRKILLFIVKDKLFLDYISSQDTICISAFFIEMYTQNCLSIFDSEYSYFYKNKYFNIKNSPPI